MKKFIARVCYCIANGTLTIVLESFVRDVCLCISIYMASVNITSTNETPHRFHLCNKSRKRQQSEQNKNERMEYKHTQIILVLLCKCVCVIETHREEERLGRSRFLVHNTKQQDEKKFQVFWRYESKFIEWFIYSDLLCLR